jgi:uncharacterized zinc-type alcohol dehydrogenase-like protein
MGGLGHIGAKLAHAMGAAGTVLSQSLSKKEDGLRLGADHYRATSDTETFRALAGSFDLIVCTVPADLEWNAYLGLLKQGGALVMVGVPEHEISVSAFPLIVGRRSLSGSYMGSIKETQEMLDFCGAHGIVAEIETIRMHDINSAFERLKQARRAPLRASQTHLSPASISVITLRRDLRHSDGHRITGWK